MSAPIPARAGTRAPNAATLRYSSVTARPITYPIHADGTPIGGGTRTAFAQYRRGIA